ncbi:transposon, En/Spm-like protein, partial [Tanacetum coccineum]
KIHACPNDCMLYWKEDAKKKKCDICGHARFKKGRKGRGKHKEVPYKVLRYLPLTPRLQRLFMSSKYAKHMSWHKKGHPEGVLTHPSDGEAWKHLDRSDPSFAEDARNVRLGLSTDGFNPFGHSSRPYSCWPVFVTPYNLPPWMCMKEGVIFLTLIIPGPHSPGKNIDVYLRPLIKELKILWKKDGVPTYDVSTEQNFQMRAALLWTINDFPAYGMVSGWSTHGKLSCPYCMENTKAFTLKHGGKPSFFDCHRQFLPHNHPYRKDKNNFFAERVEKDDPPPRLSGETLLSRLNEFPQIIFGKKSEAQKWVGYGKDHNWTKKSIFWELPYWSDNLLRHNLDVMHIEKNVFENVFNTVMDVKGKTKDNVKSRQDMKVYC